MSSMARGRGRGRGRPRKHVNVIPISKLKPNKKEDLTLEEKISIIEDYKKIGNEKVVLAGLHDCTVNQIVHVVRERKKYLQLWADQTTTDDINNTTTKNTIIPKKVYHKELAILNAVVYEWITRFRSQGFFASDEHIREIGLEVSRILKYDIFRASGSWLKRLKEKYKLDNLRLLSAKMPITKKEKTCVDVKDILLQFKNEGPPKHLPRRFLNHIDLSKFESVKHQHSDAQNSEILKLYELLKIDLMNEMPRFNSSNDYLTNITESDDFITAMGIDNDDGEKSLLENQSSAEDQSESVTPLMIKVEKVEHTPVKSQQSIKADPDTIETAKTIKSYKEALEYLRPLENFALMEEDVMAIKKICKLESLFEEELISSPI